MASDTLVLLSGESFSTIVEEGGTSAWHISPANAAKCEYVVCTRNARATWGDKREAHGTAFLIGRIKEIVPSRAALGNPQILKDRFSIVISQYLRITPGERMEERRQKPREIFVSFRNSYRSFDVSLE